MADVDIDPFGEHDRTESRTDETGKNIPFTPVGGSTWEPDRGEQETSFRGESQRTSLMKDYVKDLYKKLSENVSEIPEEFHYDYFKNKTNDLILNLTPENVTQHSRIVTTTHKGSSTPTKVSKIIGRQIH